MDLRDLDILDVINNMAAVTDVVMSIVEQVIQEDTEVDLIHTLVQKMVINSKARTDFAGDFPQYRDSEMRLMDAIKQLQAPEQPTRTFDRKLISTQMCDPMPLVDPRPKADGLGVPGFSKPFAPASRSTINKPCGVVPVQPLQVRTSNLTQFKPNVTLATKDSGDFPQYRDSQRLLDAMKQLQAPEQPTRTFDRKLISTQMCDPGCVRIWDIQQQTQTKATVYNLDCLKDQEIPSCKLTRDGTSLIFGGEASTITKWNLAGTPMLRIKGEMDNKAQACYALAISPDGKLCFSCCADSDSVVQTVTPGLDNIVQSDSSPSSYTAEQTGGGRTLNAKHQNTKWSNLVKAMKTAHTALPVKLAASKIRKRAKKVTKKVTNLRQQQIPNLPQGLKWGGVNCTNTCTIDNLITALWCYAVEDPTFLGKFGNSEAERILRSVLQLLQQGRNEKEFKSARDRWIQYIERSRIQNNLGGIPLTRGGLKDLLGTQMEFFLQPFKDVFGIAEVSTCQRCRNNGPIRNEGCLALIRPTLQIDKEIQERLTFVGLPLRQKCACGGDRAVECRGMFSPNSWCFVVNSAIHRATSYDSFPIYVNVGTQKFMLLALTLHHPGHFNSILRLRSGWYFYDGLATPCIIPLRPQRLRNAGMISFVLYVKVN